MDPTAAASQKPEPWDRLGDESAEAYTRFLLYRNLGPGRSIDAAYRLVKKGGKGEKRRAPGCWYRLAQRYDWVGRASSWDVSFLRTAGAAAVAKFVALLAEMATSSLQRIRDENLQPTTWSDVLKTVKTLGAHIPPETILKVAEAGPPQEG